MSRQTTLSPEIIGRAIDLTPLTRPLLFIIIVAAVGFFFDSFDIVIVSYAMPSIAREFVLGPKQLGLIGSSALAGMTVYTSEVFPLPIRGIATAAAMGVGRLGGMVSPIVIGVLLSFGNVMSVWFLLAAVQAGCWTDIAVAGT